MKTLKWWMISLVLFFILCPVLLSNNEVETPIQKPEQPIEDVHYDFSDCPVVISGAIARYGESYALELVFKSYAEYPISAIKCYIVYYNV